MSNNEVFPSFLLSLSFQQPSLIFHSNSWTAERSPGCHWVNCIGGSTPLPGWHGTTTPLLLSICLCCTNTTLSHNGPNPIYLVQYQVNLGFIPPVSCFHVYLLENIERKGRIFPHRSVSQLFFKTQISTIVDTEIVWNRLCISISFLNISRCDLEKWEQLKSDHEKRSFFYKDAKNSHGLFSIQHMSFYIINTHCHAASFLACTHYRKLEIHIICTTGLSSLQDSRDIMFS